jgi:hypothetical protein
MTQTVPFLLEDAIKQKGAHFEHTKAWCAAPRARNGMRACSASPERVLSNECTSRDAGTRTWCATGGW